MSSISKIKALMQRKIKRTAQLRALRSVKISKRKVIFAAGRRRGKSAYRWITRKDSRVRPLHKDLEGQVFDMYQGHPTEGHPGDPWGCRCGVAWV